MQKKDLDTDMSLVGAEIIISKEDGEEVKRFKFNDEAIDLPPGRYVLTEGEPLLGYEKLFGSCTFDLDDDGNIRIIQIVGNSNYFKTDGKVLTIYNAERRFRFTKKDLETDNKLTGSHILIQDNECNIVSEFDSEEEISEAIVLPPKYYVLTETISPEGYEPLKYRYYFQLNLSREVIIKKIELITEENNQCQPWDVSDLESEEDSDSNLDEDMEDEDDIPDKVELTEEEKNEALQYFKVDGYNITLYNKKVVVDVPDTGKNSIMYWIIGGAVLSIGILMIYLTFKKRVTQ